MKRFFLIGILLVFFLFINRTFVPKISRYRKIQKGEAGLFLLSPDAEKFISLDYEGLRSFWVTLDLRVFLATLLETHPYFPKWAGDVVYKAYRVASFLNPYYFDIYYIASLNLMWDFKRYSDAEEVLKRAIQYMPRNWLWHFFLSFEYFYFLKKYDLAAEHMKIAAKLKHSALLASLAARLYYSSGRTEIALSILDNQIRNTQNENWKKELLKRKKALLAVLKIERAIEMYERKEGKKPRTLDVLVEKGYLKKIPQDPYGGRFYIDKNGNVKSTSNFTEKRESENGHE